MAAAILAKFIDWCNSCTATKESSTISRGPSSILWWLIQLELKRGNIQDISISENHSDFSFPFSFFYSSVGQRREKGPVLRTKADIWLLSARTTCVTDPACPIYFSLSVSTASCKQSSVSQICSFGIFILLPIVSGWIQFWQILSCYLT